MPKLLARAIAVLLVALAAGARAGDLSDGQTLYLPIYSFIWHGNVNAGSGEAMKAEMSALVSIRNTSLKTPIRLRSARYYDTQGKLVKEFVGTARAIPPMGTYELFIEQSESEGGSGANFIIEWDAATETNPPMVQAVHIDNHGGRPYSFITTARPINPKK